MWNSLLQFTHQLEIRGKTAPRGADVRGWNICIVIQRDTELSRVPFGTLPELRAAKYYTRYARRGVAKRTEDHADEL
jgi:hypothetical protein